MIAKENMEIKYSAPRLLKCAEAENLVRKVAAAKGENITVQRCPISREMMAAGVMSLRQSPLTALCVRLRDGFQAGGNFHMDRWCNVSFR